MYYRMIDSVHKIRTMIRHATSVFLVSIGLLFLAVTVNAATIYLDHSNIGGPWDGKSWATAWTNVLDAIGDLATTNAVVQGGHTVMFGAGTYPTFGINASHAGTAAASNFFRGMPGAVLSRIDLSNGVGAVHFVMEDFEFDCSVDSYGIYGRASCQSFLIRNCLFYGGTPISLDHEYGCYFNNCTFAFGRNAYQNYSDVYYDNCVFVGNTPYGAYDNYSKKSRFRNCVFYGNGTANYRANLYDFNGNTAEEIDTYIASSSNNMVANPGYVNMASGNRDFSAVYTNSPLLGNALDGGNVGHIAALSSVGFTQAVLYVDSATGNDANTRLQATSPATAWATISHAASNTTPGDTILVTAGTYPEQAFINVTGSGDRTVTICSAGGSAVIGGAAVGLTLDHCLGLRINGFDVKGVALNHVYGSSIEHITSHDAADGFNMSNGGDVFFQSCTATNHTSSGFTSPYSGASGNTFDGCLADNCKYGFYLHEYQTIQNSVARSCTTYGIYQRSSAPILNSVVYGNPRGIYVSAATAHTHIRNCIIAGNSLYGIEEYHAAANVHADYNCYWDNGTAHFYDKDGFGFCTNEAQVNQMPDCSNNIVCNPSFKNPDLGDFRLSGGSCCIDAGEPNTLTNDFFGNHRPVGSGVDMGIYEMPPKGAVFTGL